MELATQALEALDVMDFPPLGAMISPLADDAPAQEALPPRPRRGEPLPAETLPEAISANWSRLAHVPLDQEAFDKLCRMAARQPGWRGAGSRPLRASALKHFIDFWSEVSPSAATPQFALLPTGHLQALWTNDKRQRMDLEFTEDSRVYFGILNGRRRLEGVELISSLTKILLAHPGNPLRWS
jgi:hypothetical protein